MLDSFKAPRVHGFLVSCAYVAAAYFANRTLAPIALAVAVIPSFCLGMLPAARVTAFIGGILVAFVIALVAGFIAVPMSGNIAYAVLAPILFLAVALSAIPAYGLGQGLTPVVRLSRALLFS